MPKNKKVQHAFSSIVRSFFLFSAFNVCRLVVFVILLAYYAARLMTPSQDDYALCMSDDWIDLHMPGVCAAAYIPDDCWSNKYMQNY